MQLGDTMKIDLKNKKGFATTDLTIAMLIALILVIIMASFSYNVYLSSIEAKRTAVALNYAIDIFELIGDTSYEDVTASISLLSCSSSIS